MKQAIVINDISGLGRCSLTAAIPILSALKIQPCPLPTAVLSAQTAYPNYYLRDLSADTLAILNFWKKSGVFFDGIYTGFFTCSGEIENVLEYIQNLKDKPFLLVDPVMGDDGEIYSSIPQDMCAKMKKLVSLADITTPNLTEACILCGEDFITISKLKGDKFFARIEKLCAHIVDMGAKIVAITGICQEDKIYNGLYCENTFKLLKTKRRGAYYSGTGDTFASIVFGYMLNGFSAQYALKKASNFIGRCIRYAQSIKAEPKNGICFEKFIKRL